MAYRSGSSDRPDLSLAVVIGAGGIGLAAARRLAQRHRLLVADLDAGKLAGAVATLRAEGCDASGIACDVTAVASVQAVAETARSLGNFRVLAKSPGCPRRWAASTASFG